MRALSWVLFVSCVASAWPAAQEFHAIVDVVRVPVVVTGPGGQLVKGLKAADFEVLEDGRPQRIDWFIEGSGGESLPLHLGLLLDVSESMQKNLPEAATASVQFVNTVPDSVDVTLVDFDTTVRLGRFAPPSYPQLFERIRNRKAGGMTALYDALAIYLDDLRSREGQHVLILYTDGGDSSSSVTFGKISELLRRTTSVIVYSIGYLENESSAVRLEQQMRLTMLARDTGGDAYFPTSGKQIREIYDRILNELTSRYTLGYVSANQVEDGRFRKLQVRLAASAGKRLTVRARPGYVAVKPVRPQGG
jgi:Ca-activated chloride channel family protein